MAAPSARATRPATFRIRTPGTYLGTMPTDLERQGDFSKSLNVSGGLRTIYDPYTTTLDAAGKVQRTPFAGNLVPGSRFDAIGARVMKGLYSPNRAPDNL